MRRAFAASASITALIVALLALKPHQLPSQGGLPGSAPGGSAASPSPSTSAHASPRSHSGTGTFTGDPIATQYGTVQVAATLNRGRLTGVKVLQAPHDNGRSREIAAQSLPSLNQEAMTAQSAHIHTVSGASYTSDGYTRSLQSALDRSHG
ncbi:FMN-binding protein [Streptomyces sp. ODS28]|uniref:FMN-binding protein n=1 Tax=Streptomyces sp. ODS28 TaxID=3136688 RepID=UPI0031EAC690